MPSLSTTTPLNAGATYNSGSIAVTRGVRISGTVFADRPGTIFIEQSGDGSNWDVSASYSVASSQGSGFEEDVVAPFFRVRFTNTSSSNQTVFRLYGFLQDVYGAFLAAASGPSSGGAWAVLQWNANTGSYIYVGRFDGLDGYNANGNAAVSKNQSGKYAAFPVVDAVVSDETLQTDTLHVADTF